MTQPLTAGTTKLPGAAGAPADGTSEDAAQTAAAFESLLLALTGTPLQVPMTAPGASVPTATAGPAIGAGVTASAGLGAPAGVLTGITADTAAGVAGPLDPSAVPEAPRGMDAPFGTVGGQPAAGLATGLAAEPVLPAFGSAAQGPAVPGLAVPGAAVPTAPAGFPVPATQTTPAGATDAASLPGSTPVSGAATTATPTQPAAPAPSGAAADRPAVPGAESDPAEQTEPASEAPESIVDSLARPADGPATALPVHTTPAPAVQSSAAPAPVHKPQPVTPPPASQLAAEIAPLRSRDGEHTLTVHLHPVDLGPITVVAQVRGQDIQLSLGGATESGREALRAALPDLRRELEQAGFNSCLFNTGTGGAREDNRPAWLRHEPDAREEGSGPIAATPSATAATAVRSRSTGVLDLHA